MVLLTNWRSDERRRRAHPVAGASDVTGGPGVPDAPAEETTAPLRVNSRRLKGTLVRVDAAMVVAAWSIALWTSPGIIADTGIARLALGTAVLIVTAMSSIALLHLYRSRVCAVRHVESMRLLWVGLITAAVGVVVLRHLGLRLPPGHVLVGAILLVVLLGAARSVFASWLQLRRSAGAFQRPLVIVGTNAEANHLEHLIQVHPELGYRLCGVTGAQTEWLRSGMTAPWLGPVSDTVEVSKAHRAGVLMAVTSIDTGTLAMLIRDLTAADVAVHASTGLTRIDHRRIRALPLAREPMFFIEPPVSSTLQDFLRRVVDVSIAALGLILVAPVIALALIAIRLDGCGGALLRQRRIGKDGRPFEMLKLRTMVPDADRGRQHLLQLNERRDGPLFKVESDPRITRVGRWLRALSIDECPQLVNVLRGDMSLVGPRPPLPDEADQFDHELLERFNVRPGITGLWQLEARDNPTFDAYRRLDLFYIENRSIGMDLAILWGTVGVVVSHALHSLHRNPSVRASAPGSPAPVSSAVVGVPWQGATGDPACQAEGALAPKTEALRDAHRAAGLGASTTM